MLACVRAYVRARMRTYMHAHIPQDAGHWQQQCEDFIGWIARKLGIIVIDEPGQEVIKRRRNATHLHIEKVSVKKAWFEQNAKRNKLLQQHEQEAINAGASASGASTDGRTARRQAGLALISLKGHNTDQMASLSDAEVLVQAEDCCYYYFFVSHDYS